MDERAPHSPACGFCRRSQEQARKLIAGPSVFICDGCVDLCHQLIEEEFGKDPAGGSDREHVSMPYGEAVRLCALLMDGFRNGNVLQMTTHDIAVLNRFHGAIEAAQGKATGTEPSLDPREP